MTVYYTELADADLSDIATYTELAHDAKQRDKYMLGLQRACNLLEEHHELLARPEPAAEGCLRYRADHHIIVFRTVPDGIEIVRILHERMDPSRHL